MPQTNPGRNHIVDPAHCTTQPRRENNENITHLASVMVRGGGGASSLSL